MEVVSGRDQDPRSQNGYIAPLNLQQSEQTRANTRATSYGNQNSPRGWQGHQESTSQGLKGSQSLRTLRPEPASSVDLGGSHSRSTSEYTWQEPQSQAGSRASLPSQRNFPHQNSRQESQRQRNTRASYGNLTSLESRQELQSPTESQHPHRGSDTRGHLDTWENSPVRTNVGPFYNNRSALNNWQEDEAAEEPRDMYPGPPPSNRAQGFQTREVQQDPYQHQQPNDVWRGHQGRQDPRNSYGSPTPVNEWQQEQPRQNPRALYNNQTPHNDLMAPQVHNDPRDDYGSPTPATGSPSLGRIEPLVEGTYCTSQNKARANEILTKFKEIKIEHKSWMSKTLMTKSKRTKFSQREIYRALDSVINGKEHGGPGVVEYLRDQYIAQGGDIDFVPQKKALTTMFRKPQEQRTGLLEAAAKDGNVETMQLLLPHADEISKKESLGIAMRNRDAAAIGGSDTTRINQMIKILILKGADGSGTIGSAVSAGDANLLQMLLAGRPPKSTLSEALPIAVALKDEVARRNILRMLLDTGADVNFAEGESIYLAVRAFDMPSLDMLLHRTPRNASLGKAFASALNLPDDNRHEVCQKLISAGAFGPQVNQGLKMAVTGQNVAFLKLVLPSASVDSEGGEAICLAIAKDYHDLLRLMLGKQPNETTFDNAFSTAIRMRNPRNQVKYCRVLLEAGPNRNTCSKALIVAVRNEREELCNAFLEKGASPDFNSGEAISAAASSENIGILELLVGSQYQKPRSDSLVTGFEAALGASQQKKMKLLKIILDAGLKGPALDSALVNAAKSKNDAFVRLFLEYGASVNYQTGEALDVITRCGNIEILQLLLKGPDRPLAKALSRIFQTALKLDPEIRHLAARLILEARLPVDGQVAAALDALVQDRRPDIQTIDVLLSHGASVHHENHRPLVTAAESLNQLLLSRLLENLTDHSAVSSVFQEVTRKGSFWEQKEAFTILKILLDYGAHGTSVNEALITVVSDTQPDARHFEIVLLQYRIDINFKDGMALQIATERGEPSLIREMLAKNPTTESLSMAFPYIFHSSIGDVNVLEVIELFGTCSGKLDPRFQHPNVPEPPVFLCLNYFPSNLKILEATLNAGYHVDQMMSSPDGNLTALYHAISTTKRPIGDAIVELLINRGANLNNHPEPLLHLAIENRRHQIVQSLLNKGADADTVNEDDLTPLNLATMKNDLISMQALLDADASPNDNSLHYAARVVNTDAITLLLEYGHDPNFPSARLDGRPPLFELCYTAPAYLHNLQITAQNKEKQTKLAIKALVTAGALIDAQLPQAGNRSILIHALDSSNPLMMAQAFLECAAFRQINEDFNLFSDGEFTYSPTKYVEKRQCRGDNTQTQSVLKLLKRFNATDRYWRNSGPQPPDMINPPPLIARLEKERLETERKQRAAAEAKRQRIEAEQLQLAEQRRKRAMKMEEDLAIQEKADREFRMQREHDRILHEATIAKQNDHLRVLAATDAQRLRQATSMSTLKINENRIEYEREMKLIEGHKSLVESKNAMAFAFNQGLEAAGSSSGGRRALGPANSRRNMNLDFKKRMQIEGPRITELYED